MSIGTVRFIGAGPGDPELLTLRAARLIREAGLVVYAGSLVPAQVVAMATGRVEDSAPLTLEQTHALLRAAALAGQDVARVHTGDPSLYGAVQEQARLLDAEGIPWEVVPGVTAALAAAAAARVSFTQPGGTQSLVVTRLGGRTPVPPAEALASLAAHGSAVAVYLSAGEPERLAAELAAAGRPPDTRVILAHRVGWPDERIIDTTLEHFVQAVRAAGIGRQAVALVLPPDPRGRSGLYDPDFGHGYRPTEK